MRTPRSLTSRLVITAVALVALTTLLIGLATTLAMRAYLTGQLDRDVRSTLGRAYPAINLPGDPGDHDHDDGPGRGGPDGRGQQIGTLVATLGSQGNGAVLAESGHRTPSAQVLTPGQLAALNRVTQDGSPHQVDLPGLGTYRVIAIDGNLAGLPMSDVQDSLGSLIRAELLLTLLGIAVATVAGLAVVRRQLAPLREVAETAETVSELPLSEGEFDLSERVPAHLTDEHTEVGQVGASLNRLLDHVETSLQARHRSEQQVRQFVADASHELRTPLATIRGYAELARRRPDDAETTRTALDRVESASDRMSSLVEDLLLLARLDSGRPLESAPVDLTKLVVEAVSDARVVSPEHRWQLDLPEVEVVVPGDEQRLHQALTNLLTNAQRYTPPGTTITVRTRRGELSVHDDGPGFPADVASRAFERFVRGDESRTRYDQGTDGGTGLGLSLVQAIAHAHGGHVTLSSAPGDTTIRLSLPPR